MIDIEIENVSLELEATDEATGRPAKEVFCEKWESAKTGLSLLLLVTKNPIVKLVVQTIINLGDKIQEKTC